MKKEGKGETEKQNIKKSTLNFRKVISQRTIDIGEERKHINVFKGLNKYFLDEYYVPINISLCVVHRSSYPLVILLPK